MCGAPFARDDLCSPFATQPMVHRADHDTSDVFRLAPPTPLLTDGSRLDISEVKKNFRGWVSRRPDADLARPARPRPVYGQSTGDAKVTTMVIFFDMPSDVLPLPPGADSEEIRQAFEYVLALERAEDPEGATFALRNLNLHLQHFTPAPHTFIQLARYARDAGDVSPWTLTWLTNRLAELMCAMEDGELGVNHLVPASDEEDAEQERREAEQMARVLESLGASRLAQLKLANEETYFNTVDDARLRMLNLEDRAVFDETHHMLPTTAAAIARALVAHAAEIPADDRALVNLAHRVVASAEPQANVLPQFERKSVVTLVSDAWRYTSLWQAAERAQAVLERYPSVVEDDFRKVLALKAWLEAEKPPLLEVGLVTLGFAATLPPRGNPPTPPLLGRAVARSIRAIASEWLRRQGYVRAHEVLLAALAEGDPQPL